MPDDPVAQSKMPNRRSDRVWGGPGVGAPCTICGRVVSRDEMEFEVELCFLGLGVGAL